MNTLLLPKQIELPTADILYLKSESNYTYIYGKSNRRNLLVALSLCKIQAELDDKKFVRVNRSNLINIRFVNHYKITSKNVILTLNTGQTLTSSRRRTESILEKLHSILI